MLLIIYNVNIHHVIPSKVTQACVVDLREKPVANNNVSPISAACKNSAAALKLKRPFVSGEKRTTS